MTHPGNKIPPDSNDRVADRPLRNNFNTVIFSLMAVMAVVILAGALFFHMRALPGPTAHPQNTPAPTSSNPSTNPQ